MDTATVTLTEFLRARIDEDEAALNAEAREKLGEAGPWFHLPRALRKCEAIRRIVELRENLARHAEETGEPVFYTSGGTVDGVLDILATVYSDHPDYREEWRP